MNYIGIDLHSNNSMIVVLDEAGRVLAQQRQHNVLREIQSSLQPWQAENAGVVIESTYNWYWLVDGLQDAGYTVHLANPGGIRQYDGLKHKGDAEDARHLADLLRLGILPTGTILPREIRAIRDLARKRMQLVRSRTQHILAVENLLARQGCEVLVSHQIKKLSTDAVAALAVLPDVQLAIASNIAVIGTLNERIEQLEKRLAESVQNRVEYDWLTSAPGIGRILATVILLEIGLIERFASAGDFASYARCVNSAHQSNDKKKGQGNTKNGNKYLAWAFMEAANHALRFNAEAKRFYERKKSRRNRIVALKALAHKLARACYHMLKEGKPFDVTRCFG